MLVIGRKKLEAFFKGRPDVEKRLWTWHNEAKNAKWKMPHEVKKMYRTASILKNGRVVFNICGNKYRLLVQINYAHQIVEIRFMDTHNEYDRINAEEI